MLEYKGYVGKIEFEPDDRAFHGEVIGLADAVVHFTGKTVEEVEEAFRSSVEEYLAFCQEKGIAPDKPYSGHIMLRVNPDKHRKAALMAEVSGLSINKWVESLIERA